MAIPSAEIAALAASHSRLHDDLAELSDDQAACACLLPGWTVAHLVTHLARNADSVVRRVAARLDGELVTQYEHGAEGRAKDIEAGARRPAEALVADLRSSDDRLDALLASAPASLWDSTLMAGGSEIVSAGEVVFHRWREVEVHHVDLGLSYSAADWPDELVARWLPSLTRELPERADPHTLLAWAIGRGEAPQLGGRWH